MKMPTKTPSAREVYDMQDMQKMMFRKRKNLQKKNARSRKKALRMSRDTEVYEEAKYEEPEVGKMSEEMLAENEESLAEENGQEISAAEDGKNAAEMTPKKKKKKLSVENGKEVENKVKKGVKAKKAASVKKRKSVVEGNEAEENVMVEEGVKKKKKNVKARKAKQAAANGAEAEVEEQQSSENEQQTEAYQDSKKEGQKAFQRLISPVSEKDFFEQYWEQKPLHVQRKCSDYFEEVFSTQELDSILRQNRILYSKNLDITSYSQGKRETHNPVGQAHAPVVWDYYNNGCSIRLLNPQTYSSRVWKLLATLQEHFKSFCGANVYLTPPGTQGFAPHWDDIEAFILQLEGKKHWKVYKPREDSEELPENSSPNLPAEGLGKPVLDVVLEPGDLLYFPRGFIHQGHTISDHHSLHITLSTYQKNTWGHYLEKLLPQALTIAMSEDVEFRRGLPLNYLDCMGIVHMDRETPQRKEFTEKVGELVMRMLQYAPYDAAVDQRGASLMHESLPPYLTDEERKCSVTEGGEMWNKTENKVVHQVKLDADTPIRLLRRNCLRVVAQEDGVHVYHCLENTRVYREVEEPQYVELDPDHAPAIEALIHTYPKYMTIDSLPIPEKDTRMAVASGLWERGLVVTKLPMFGE